LLRSFGRTDGDGNTRGLTERQKQFLLALGLWKIDRLLHQPFRYRSGCYLERKSLLKGVPQSEDTKESKKAEEEITIDPRMKDAIGNAQFRENPDEPLITDIYWPEEELYREPQGGRRASSTEPGADEDEEDGSEEATEDA
jgi:CRISPR-associated protein Csb1